MILPKIWGIIPYPVTSRVRVNEPSPLRSDDMIWKIPAHIIINMAVPMNAMINPITGRRPLIKAASGGRSGMDADAAIAAAIPEKNPRIRIINAGIFRLSGFFASSSKNSPGDKSISLTGIMHKYRFVHYINCADISSIPGFF